MQQEKKRAKERTLVNQVIDIFESNKGPRQESAPSSVDWLLFIGCRPISCPYTRVAVAVCVGFVLLGNSSCEFEVAAHCEVLHLVHVIICAIRDLEVDT